jgi:hypothetical protein
MAPLIRPSGILPPASHSLPHQLPAGRHRRLRLRARSIGLAPRRRLPIHPAGRSAVRRLQGQWRLRPLISDCLLFVGVLGGVAAGFALSSSGVIWTLTSWIFGCALALIPASIRAERRDVGSSSLALVEAGLPPPEPALALGLRGLLRLDERDDLHPGRARIALGRGQCRSCQLVVLTRGLGFTGITMWLFPWLAKRGSTNTYRA